MYKEFYNIKTDPFSTLPSPAIFFDSGTHQNAWEYLIQGTSCQEHFLLVTGDHGTGKTLLCMKLMHELLQKKTCSCVYIPVTSYSYAYLLNEIASQLNISIEGSNEAAIQHAISQHFKHLSRDTSIYIILDDIQDMELPTLKKLLLLANVNYNEVFPVNFALFAHNSFLDQLSLTDLNALHYKIKQPFNLSCLDMHETKEYIYFRLLKADAPGIPAFSDDALKEIYSYSNGIPQLINKICAACLVQGAAQKSIIIDTPIVLEAQKAIAIGYGEKRAELKVPLADGAQIPVSPIDARTRDHGVTGYNSIQKALNKISNLIALLIFALIIFFSTQIVINYFQYHAITSLNKIPFKTNSLIQPEVRKESFQVSTIPVQEEKTLSTTLTQGPENTSITPQPETTSIKITASELTTSVPENEKAALPAEYKQQTTSIYPEQKTDEKSTSTLEPVTSTIPGKTVNYPFTIQLACYNSLEGAKERIVLFKKIGLSPYLIKSLSKKSGELFWVICDGYYTTQEDAERARLSYKLSEAIVVKTPYANLVGVYSKPEEMAEMINRLEKSDHFPYVIKDINNLYRLYVGAFTTKQGAVNYNAQLRAMGITATVEER